MRHDAAEEIGFRGGKMKIIDQIGNVNDRDTFIEFLNLLAKDFEEKPQEWENATVPQYLQSIAGWIEDSGDRNGNGEYDKLNYQELAKIFYVGKIYE
jgi:hypothetical protein